VLILYGHLNCIEKLFHGVVEDTEISPSSNDIFFNNLDLLVKLLSTFVKIVEKVLILIVLLIEFFPKLFMGYILNNHSFASRLSFCQTIPY